MKKTGENNDPRILRLRPHHGLCLQFFEGRGYSEGFAAHMGKVKNILSKGGRVLIVDSADEICGRCPNLQDGACISDGKVYMYDQRVLELCELTYGETLSFRELSGRVMQKIILASGRKTVCPDCQWREICGRKENEFRRL